MSKKNYISLIIPVYNCEKFLPALFSSIDNQSVKPGEVIIIDDNSVDNSAKLIKEYAKHNNNIKTVFLRKNKGVSYARNKGFELAKGDYLWFIDGDDQLNDNALKGIYSEIQKNNSIEAFVSGYNNLDGQGNFLSERKFLQFDIKKSYPGSEIFKQFNPAPWNKIFKTSFWKKHNFTFPLNISISQDLSIIYYAIFKASKVKILPNCLYNYCYNESSTVNSFNTKKIKDIFAGNQQLFNNFFTEKKALSEAIKLEVSEISIHSIDYFYCRFQSSFSKKDHLLFLDLFNNFLGTNNIDIHSLLSWEIGSKTLIEVDKGIVSNRIKGFINVPFRSDKLLTQIQKIKKLELSNAQTIQDLQQEITNQKYLLSHEKENYELQRNGLNEKIHELEKNIHEHIAFGSKKDEQVNSLSVEKQQLLETAKMLETSYIQKQNSLNNSIEQLNHQLQTKEQEVKSLQKKLTSSEDQNKEYKLRLDKIRLQNEKLEQNIGNIQNSLISSEEQNTNHKLNIDNLYSENKLLIEQIQSKKNEISHLQNKLISSESLNNTYKNQSFKLELEISKLSEAINWYKRTYQDRKLPGIIKDRIIKTIPLFRSENYISQWKNLTRIFRRKNKLKKATVKSTVSKKILCTVVNYNCNDNALKLKNSFSKFFDTIVFDSGSKEKNKNFVLLDNVYYSGLFNRAYQFALENNYEFLLYICSDVEVQDEQIEIMVNNLNKFDLDKVGVYSPSSTGRSHFYCKRQNTDGLRSVPFVEGFMFLAHLDVLKKMAPIDLNINKYGWGLDVAKGYFARKLNRFCLVDDAVSVHHPEGTGYSDKFAEVGMWEWMETFQDENFKKFYTRQIDVIRQNQAGLNKVSVIIPCYNQAAYIEATIHSLLMQDHGYIEIIILNDGSTDNTEEIAKKYCLDFPNIKYILKQNGGLGHTRNEGLKYATGDFIQFLDSDDLLSSNKISEQVYTFILNPEIQVSYSAYLCFEDGAPEKTWTYSRLILKEDPVLDLIQNWETELSIPIHCFLFRKPLLENLFFDIELPNHEDWEFHLKVAAQKPVYKYEPNGIAYYRVRNTSMSRDKELMIKGKKMCIQKAIDSNKFSHVYLRELHKRLSEN